MGRPIGSKNKLSKSAKENIQAVFVRLGSTSGMAKWAKDNQTEFYRIYSRLLPVEIEGELNLVPADVSDKPISAAEWETQAQDYMGSAAGTAKAPN